MNKTNAADHSLFAVHELVGIGIMGGSIIASNKLNSQAYNLFIPGPPLTYNCRNKLPMVLRGY